MLLLSERKGRKAFRAAFGDLSILRSLCKQGICTSNTWKDFGLGFVIRFNLVSPSVVKYLMMKLGESAYSPKGSRNPNDCLIGIFHSRSWQKCKDRVLNAMKGEGKTKIVVASTALSMGVNFPNIRFIINWGPHRTVLEFHQARRARRDTGELSTCVLILKLGRQPEVSSFPLHLVLILPQLYLH